jgi:hypothetical protein
MSRLVEMCARTPPEGVSPPEAPGIIAESTIRSTRESGEDAESGAFLSPNFRSHPLLRGYFLAAS